MGKEASTLGCDVLLIPGGIYLGGFRPFVSMVQNMQVFEWPELRREGISKEGGRLLVLQILQGFTFFRSSGMIFMSHYCLKYFQENLKWLLKNVNVAVVPHGINYSNHRKLQKSIDLYSDQNPFQILYVSTVKNYKHQWNLIDAVGKLRSQGYPLNLNLVGGGDRSALKKMHKAVARNRTGHSFVSYHGDQSHESTLHFFEQADVFAFPSTCDRSL